MCFNGVTISYIYSYKENARKIEDNFLRGKTIRRVRHTRERPIVNGKNFKVNSIETMEGRGVDFHL